MLLEQIPGVGDTLRCAEGKGTSTRGPQKDMKDSVEWEMLERLLLPVGIVLVMKQ